MQGSECSFGAGSNPDILPTEGGSLLLMRAFQSLAPRTALWQTRKPRPRARSARRESVPIPSTLPAKNIAGHSH